MARMPAHVLALLLLLPIAAIAADPPTLTEEHLRFRQQSAARDEARLRGFLAANEGELATTAGEVLARHHAATGGLEAWRAVESLKMTFRGGAGSSELVLERCYRRPDLYRQEVVGSPGASVSDGERVWRQGPDGSWSEAPSNGYRWFGGLDGNEITIFDSTGLAVQDVVTAGLIYRRAREQGIGTNFDFMN